MVLSLGFMLYRSQTKMNLRQSDAAEAQLTIDYLVNSMRTMVVSAGGGLPQMANGIRKHATGKGITTYVNSLEASSAVVLDSVSDTTDGVIQVVDIAPFTEAAFVLLTRNEEIALARVASVDVPGEKIHLADPSQEDRLGGGAFAYPVEYCSLFVDVDSTLRKSMVGKSESHTRVPLAVNVDSIDVSYDLSPAGNGTFTNAVTDSSKISRVKLFVRVSGEHRLAGTTKRSYETIIGVRRGRLYNGAI
jgi:hypothetical protein